jgi:hypothetical protein
VAVAEDVAEDVVDDVVEDVAVPPGLAEPSTVDPHPVSSRAASTPTSRDLIRPPC